MSFQLTFESLTTIHYSLKLDRYGLCTYERIWIRPLIINSFAIESVYILLNFFSLIKLYSNVIDKQIMPSNIVLLRIFKANWISSIGMISYAICFEYSFFHLRLITQGNRSGKVSTFDEQHNQIVIEVVCSWSVAKKKWCEL